MTLGLLVVVVLIASLTQTVTGFGSGLVIVTLGSYLMERQALLATVIPLAVLQTVYVLYRDRSHIAVRLLVRSLLPWMGVGVLVGYGLAKWLAAVGVGGALLIRLFGVLVGVLAVIELRKLAKVIEHTVVIQGGALSRAWLGISGVLHGIYATGGPTLVYALGKSGLDRRAFRSTLAVVWFTLDGLLMALFWADGFLGLEQAKMTLGLLPGMVLGVLIGQWVHGRVNEKTFRVALFGMLMLAGVTLALRG